jgi:hypothetical protein
MGKKVERLTIGIFGPSDCVPEKERLKRLIAEDLSLRDLARKFDLILQSCSGDEVTSGPGRPQERINRYIADSDPDLSIFIFKDTFGSDAGLGWTGSEEEWKIGIETLVARPGFDIGLYFSTRDPSDDRLSTFRKQIEDEYLAYYTLFDDLADFEAQIRHKLTRFLWDYAERTNDKPEAASVAAVQAFAASPYSLATYPRVLPGGEELVRPELNTLLERIRGHEASATVVLGERGSGKSALFAALDSELRASGFAVLSIKADMLGPAVHDEAALGRVLRLPLGFTASVQLVAMERPVVILVDQLDALADVLDRKTERLNVLLNAIRSVSNAANVHLVMSSRPVEYHHDVRLRSMAVERLDLELPPWTDVAPILEKHGYAAESISEPVRELLRNPWALNEFLLLRPTAVSFGSLFALLEEVWAATVESAEAPGGTRELVEAMLDTMSREEVLWIPRSIAAKHERARRYLLDRDVIQLDESRLQVAFRHQSFFEFALVRRFAAGTESFAEYVSRRSQGLFIRPVALAGLAYLRGTVPLRYQEELQGLWDAQPRTHLRALIVDFIAAQTAPLPTEISIIKEMLSDDRQGPRALAAMAPYAHWLPILRPTAVFLAWLRRPPTEAIHVTGLLASGAARSPEEVLDAIEREWLRDPKYDLLSFSVLYNVQLWSERLLDVLLRIVARSSQGGVYDLALQMIGTNPVFAARLLRAELDRRLTEIIAGCSTGLILERALERLLDDDEHTGVFADLAETSPDAFLSSLFPWIVMVLEASREDAQPRFQQYRHDRVSLSAVGEVPAAALIEVMTSALAGLASADADRTLELLEPYLTSETMGVHRFAAVALCAVAATRPSVVAAYLLRDRRRLAIATWGREHEVSKLLIEAAVPHLSNEEVRKLESAVLEYDYFIAPDDQLTEEQRVGKAPWNREHRLFLLQSFPDEYLSDEALKTKHELEAEFPGLDESAFGEITGGEVKAPYDRAALERQTDDEIVRVFDELTDQTGWDHPRRWSTDGDHLVGGAIQQSRVIAELAEIDPERAFRLAQRFRPNDQELPTAQAITGLANTTFDAQRLVTLILELAAKGFTSDEFVTSAARALTKVSDKLHGLPENAIALLQCWLGTVGVPAAQDGLEAPKSPSHHPLVVGPGAFFLEPDGRGPIVEAIASGYLDREVPDIRKWVEIVRARLDVESDPRVWVMTMLHLQGVLREDAALGTELFSAIFERHPDVLKEQFTWLIVAHWMGSFTPTDAVLRWLDALSEFDDPRSQQAMGELLYLFAARATGSTGRDRIRAHLGGGTARYVIRGLAYASAFLWGDVSMRSLGVEVLTTEIRHWPEDAARTLSSLIVRNREELDLDDLTQKLFLEAATNAAILLDIFPELGEEIESHTIEEPAFVAAIARAFVAAPVEQVEGVLGPIHRGNVPQVITSIALTLHRMPKFAAVGLDLFEKLLDANLREARAATELLDRKPSRKLIPRARRPRRPRRRRR